MRASARSRFDGRPIAGFADAGFKQEGDELRIIVGTRDGHDGHFRGSKKTSTTSVPSGSQFQSKALQDAGRVGRDYTVLLEGRFVKDGKVVKKRVH